MSRPRTPRALLQMRGSPRGRSRDDPLTFSRGVPNPPGWLDKEAKAEWRRVVAKVSACLDEVDRAGLALLCTAWSDFVSATYAIRKQGLTLETPNGFTQKNPMVTIRNESFERWRKLAIQYGLTPSAREQLSTPEPKPDARGKARFLTPTGDA